MTAYSARPRERSPEDVTCALHTDIVDDEEHECKYARVYWYANPSHRRCLSILIQDRVGVSLIRLDTYPSMSATSVRTRVASQAKHKVFSI